MEKQKDRIVFRINESQKMKIQRESEKVGLTMGGFCRSLVLKKIQEDEQ